MLPHSGTPALRGYNSDAFISPLLNAFFFKQDVPVRSFLAFKTLTLKIEQHFIIYYQGLTVFPNFQLQRLLPRHNLFAICVRLVIKHCYYSGLHKVGPTYSNTRNFVD